MSFSIVAPTAALQKIKRAHIDRVNSIMGELRKEFITDIPGQDMVYERKAQSALRWLEAGQPEDLSDFPLIAREVGVTAPTAYELAQLWLNLSSLWEETASIQERMRSVANKSIEEASTEEEIHAAMASFLADMAEV